jgi:hypothetical protein
LSQDKQLVQGQASNGTLVRNALIRGTVMGITSAVLFPVLGPLAPVWASKSIRTGRSGHGVANPINGLLAAEVTSTSTDVCRSGKHYVSAVEQFHVNCMKTTCKSCVDHGGSDMQCDTSPTGFDKPFRRPWSATQGVIR